MGETLVERMATAMLHEETWNTRAIAALRALQTPEFDGPLNEAGWAMVNSLQELGPLNGAQFNNMKACLRLAFLAYVDAALSEASEGDRP